MHGAYLGGAGDASQPSRQANIPSIDLNADLGEHDGKGYDGDESLLDVVSSASIACGGHAGNRRVMEETARRAAARGVAIGAHPSYPDREGFGRRETELPLTAITDAVRAQLEAMIECAAIAGARVAYVKPHGALYNRAMKDTGLAATLAQLVAEMDPELVVLALPGSALARQAATAGLRTAREAFIDRAYSGDGSLLPRSLDGAVIHDTGMAASRAVRMAREGIVEALDGTRIQITPDSLCVHSDSGNALALVTAARDALKAAGFTIGPFA